MGGGLMQLVAYGAQDVYLTGNPQITFFKVVYRRHTNFSMESIEQTINGTAAGGNRVTATISRNGDLITNMWVDVEITAAAAADELADRAGLAALESVEIEIGGQRIDKQYSKWLDIWGELTTKPGHHTGWDGLVSVPTPATATSHTAHVPLQFWFCRNPGLALPLIALQYHEVKVVIQFAPNTTVSSTGGIGSAKLWVDYIYLDTDERRRFAQVSHEYLIEQVQFTGSVDSAQSSHRLNFNHPVKELIWVNQSAKNVEQQGVAVAAADPGNHNGPNAWNTYTAATGSAKLQLNGHDRMAERDAIYFSQIQPYQHHTNVPPIDSTQTKSINVYSFALKPEDHQPSGTCNFSRIDNAVLSVECAAGALFIFAVNCNVLRIMGGMGGLAYSN